MRRVATHLIYSVGYEAMNMRDLAEGINRKPGSLYNYFKSKQELLLSIIEEHMVLVIEAAKDAIDPTATPLAQLIAFIEFHISYHIDKRELLYVVSSELRSLTKENRAKIIRYRQEYESLLTTILDKGKAAGEFNVYDTKLATFSILAVLTGVSNWYQYTGRYSPKDIVRAHIELILNGIRGKDSDRSEDLNPMADDDLSAR